MHPIDAQQAGFAEHQRVSVRGDAGQLDNIEIIFGEVRSGAALMFYPEANVLMKARIEVRSGTPAYKRVPVAIFARAV
jgi:anaerobic selenocysteine-containing dehydrogenase